MENRLADDAELGSFSKDTALKRLHELKSERDTLISKKRRSAQLDLTPGDLAEQSAINDSIKEAEEFELHIESPAGQPFKEKDALSTSNNSCPPIEVDEHARNTQLEGVEREINQIEELLNRRQRNRSGASTTSSKAGEEHESLAVDRDSDTISKPGKRRTGKRRLKSGGASLDEDSLFFGSVAEGSEAGAVPCSFSTSTPKPSVSSERLARTVQGKSAAKQKKDE